MKTILTLNNLLIICKSSLQQQIQSMIKVMFGVPIVPSTGDPDIKVNRYRL